MQEVCVINYNTNIIYSGNSVQKHYTFGEDGKRYLHQTGKLLVPEECVDSNVHMFKTSLSVTLLTLCCTWPTVPKACTTPTNSHAHAGIACRFKGH